MMTFESLRLPVVILFSWLIKKESLALRKVLIPAVYKEWHLRTPPQWISNSTIRDIYNYSVFLYQKSNASEPNYISTNRGRENGPYYRYIVDHYNNFPDVAIFVHAHPFEHQPKLLDLIRCISPNASYLSINFQAHVRSTAYWKKHEIWVEQCWRDILKEVWNMTTSELAVKLPHDKPISVSFYCCQQFILSREMVHRRSLDSWKRLQDMLGERDVCHEGEPDYESLYAYQVNPTRVGPEPSDLDDMDGVTKGTGRVTQAVASEHLAHVIFGHADLDMSWYTMETLCQNFLPRTQCPGSPCITEVDPALTVNGTLIRQVHDRVVYIMCSGKRYKLRHGTLLQRLGHTFDDVKVVETPEFIFIRDGGSFRDSRLNASTPCDSQAPLALKDGDIVRKVNGKSVYLVCGKERFTFRHSSGFHRLGKTFDDVLVMDEEIEGLRDAGWFHELRVTNISRPCVEQPGLLSLPNGTLVRPTSSKTVYMVCGRDRYVVRTKAQLLALGVGASLVIVDDDDLSSFREAGHFTEHRLNISDPCISQGPLNIRNGTLVRFGAKSVYMICGGHRYGFKSASSFQRLGYTFEDVLNDEAYKYLPEASSSFEEIKFNKSVPCLNQGVDSLSLLHGALVRAASGGKTIYLVCHKSRYIFKRPSVFSNAGLSYDDIVTISDTDFHALKDAGAVSENGWDRSAPCQHPNHSGGRGSAADGSSSLNGLFIRVPSSGRSALYLYCRGKQIYNFKVTYGISNLGYSHHDDVISMSERQFKSLKEKEGYVEVMWLNKSDPCHRSHGEGEELSLFNGLAVRTAAADKNVYLACAGVLYSFKGSVFSKLGYSFDDVVSIPKRQYSLFKDGGLVQEQRFNRSSPCRNQAGGAAALLEGTVVRAAVTGEATYLVCGGKRYNFNSSTVALTTSDIVSVIGDDDMKSIPSGGPVESRVFRPSSPCYNQGKGLALFDGQIAQSPTWAAKGQLYLICGLKRYSFPQFSALSKLGYTVDEIVPLREDEAASIRHSGQQVEERRFKKANPCANQRESPDHGKTALDGAVVRSASGGKYVYLVCGDEMFAFANAGSFAKAGYSNDQLITLESREFAAMKDGGLFDDRRFDRNHPCLHQASRKRVNWLEGALIRGPNTRTVHIVCGGKRYSLQGSQFVALGFSYDSVISVSEAELNAHPHAGTYPSGQSFSCQSAVTNSEPKTTRAGNTGNDGFSSSDAASVYISAALQLLPLALVGCVAGFAAVYALLRILHTREAMRITF